MRENSKSLYTCLRTCVIIDTLLHIKKADTCYQHQTSGDVC